MDAKTETKPRFPALTTEEEGDIAYLVTEIELRARRRRSSRPAEDIQDTQALFQRLLEKRFKWAVEMVHASNLQSDLYRKIILHHL